LEDLKLKDIVDPRGGPNHFSAIATQLHVLLLVSVNPRSVNDDTSHEIRQGNGSALVAIVSVSLSWPCRRVTLKLPEPTCQESIQADAEFDDAYTIETPIYRRTI